MYESFFGLRERPFPASPAAAKYFPAEAVEHGRKQLERCILRGEGTGLIVGGAGTGKTMLLNVLANQFREKFHIALLTSTSLCTRRALLQSILFELKLPYRGMEEGELRLSLIDHLQPSRECPNGMLLLIDEAHTLPLRLLEEIRLITNLAQDGMPRVRLVMAGSMSLEERFTSPKLASFNQRVASRCYLHPMNPSETAKYVRHHLEQAGAKPGTILTEDAARAIHAATDGIPRLINQVCDHALMLAAAGGKRLIDAAGIQEAWADLQQLPAPTMESPKTSAAIEFGALQDDEDTFTSDPAQSVHEKLDCIDLKLAELEEMELCPPTPPTDFQPRASVPELEVTFTNREQLFGAAFDEEEVVIDRYAALDASVLKSRPKVSTPEGRAFSIEVRLATPERPSLKLVDIPDCTSEAETAEEPPAKRITPKEKSGPLARQVAKAKQKQTETPREPIVLTKPDVDRVTVSASFAHSEELEELSPENDADYDPVYPESNSDVSAPSHVAKEVEMKAEAARAVPLTAPVRPKRPEFRQLFANLRGAKS
jgi:type II secretory pathway predicted ATPase ExeA